MKKTLVSLATASLIASTAMAADKGIDLDVTGQAVVYYNTNTKGTDNDLFSKDSSKANVGVQFNIASELKNGIVFGSQISYLGTAGLEKNLVSGTMQDTTQSLNANTSDQLMLTKIFVAKKIANTTLKIGRQELPKALSPLAFSEGWNVFKNTFDAVLVVNSDLPNTTLVGAYVGATTNQNLSNVDDLTATAMLGNGNNNNIVKASANVNKTAYMLTVQNTALPMTTVTASYYALSNVDVANHTDALWLDAKVADKSLPMGLKVGVQMGQISSDAETTSAFGMKVSAKPMTGLTLCGAYSGVDDGNVAVVNTGGAKTPLYTQMIANQNAIALDADTFMLKGVYSLGDNGTVIAQTTMTTAGKYNINGDGTDNREFDLLYKTKLASVNLLGAYVNTKNKDKSAVHTLRVVARYSF